MLLRHELEPFLDIADTLYPDILTLIQEFGDDNAEALAEGITQITGEHISVDTISHFWEGVNDEFMAYSLAIPNAHKVENFTKEELKEVISRILNNESDQDADKSEAIKGYYLQVLEKNLACPNPTDYIYKEDASIDEIADNIWNYKPIQL